MRLCSPVLTMFGVSNRLSNIKLDFKVAKNLYQTNGPLACDFNIC